MRRLSQPSVSVHVSVRHEEEVVQLWRTSRPLAGPRRRQIRGEMFYLTTHSTPFIYSYMEGRKCFI